jgi:hypothetical protein
MGNGIAQEEFLDRLSIKSMTLPPTDTTEATHPLQPGHA